jgi:peptidoglycan/LPS O-acetylase OafA/YrhL
LDGLLFGCALAVWGNPALDPHRGHRRWLLWVALPISVGALLFSFILRDVAFRETWRYTIQGLALMPIFISVIRHADWLPLRFLNWSWVRQLGVLSYAFYLVHSLVIALVKTHLPLSKLGQGITALVLSLGLAWLIHGFLEKPCARLKKAFAAKSCDPRLSEVESEACRPTMPSNAPKAIQRPASRRSLAFQSRDRSLRTNDAIQRAEGHPKAHVTPLERQATGASRGGSFPCLKACQPASASERDSWSG